MDDLEAVVERELEKLEAARLPECSFDDGKSWVTDDVAVAETFASAATTLRTLLDALRQSREALEPFAAFAENVDATGWTSNIHREGISVWFGPSDFRKARAALSPKTEGA